MNSARKMSRRDFMRITSLTATGALLVACAPAGTAPAQPAGAAAEQPAASEAATEMDWWVAWGEGVWGDACDNIAALYMEQEPSVQVNVLKGGATLEKLLTAVAGGTPPDVMTSIWTPDLALRGALIPVDDMIDASGLDRDNFFDALWTRASWDGQAYGLPAVEAAFIVGLGWNKNQFEDAGLDPDVAPTTWEEMRAFSDEMTVKDDAGNVTVMGFRPTDGIGSVLAVWAALAGAEYFDPATGTYDFTTPEIAAAAEYILGYYEAYGPENMVAFATNYGGWTGSANSAFTRGVQGLIINGYWMPGELTKLAPPEYEFGYDWVPSLTEKKIQMVGGWTNVIPVGAADPQQSWDFMLVASSDEASQIALDTAGGFAASRSFLEGIDASQYPGLGWFLTSGLEADKVVGEPNFPGYSIAQNNWNSMIEEVAFGRLTLEEGLAELEKVTQTAYDEAVAPGS